MRAAKLKTLKLEAPVIFPNFCFSLSPRGGQRLTRLLAAAHNPFGHWDQYAGLIFNARAKQDVRGTRNCHQDWRARRTNQGRQDREEAQGRMGAHPQRDAGAQGELTYIHTYMAFSVVPSFICPFGRRLCVDRCSDWDYTVDCRLTISHKVC